MCSKWGGLAGWMASLWEMVGQFVEFETINHLSVIAWCCFVMQLKDASNWSSDCYSCLSVSSTWSMFWRWWSIDALIGTLIDHVVGVVGRFVSIVSIIGIGCFVAGEVAAGDVAVMSLLWGGRGSPWTLRIVHFHIQSHGKWRLGWCVCGCHGGLASKGCCLLGVLHVFLCSKMYWEGQISNLGQQCCFLLHLQCLEVIWGKRKWHVGRGGEGWCTLSCSCSHGEWQNHQQSYVDLHRQHHQMILWAVWCRTFRKVIPHSMNIHRCKYYYS